MDSRFIGTPNKRVCSCDETINRGETHGDGQEPPNIQVVVSSTDENSVLINKDGIICTIKPSCDHVVHMSSQLVDAV